MTVLFQDKKATNEAGCLPRIAQADNSAARECVDAYGALIWTLAKQFTSSDDAAEKAVQEIFVDIWENAAFCDLTLSDEKVWIAMIARRRLTKLFAENKLQTTANYGQTTSANLNSRFAA